MQSVRRITPWRRPSDAFRRARKDNSSKNETDRPMVKTDEPSADDKATAVDALNADLEAVVAVFPDVRPEVFRELLLSFSGDSRLYLVAEALLMNKPKVVRGRWRAERVTDDDDADAPPPPPLLPPSERFRSEAYKAAVAAALGAEFKSLTRSAVRAVLAEHNHSYTDARPALLQLASSTWSSALYNWLARRKAPSAESHPLIEWDAAAEVGPRVRPVASAELEEELDTSLVAPVRAKRVREQLEADARTAEELNEEEAEKEGATFDCECCYTASSFERIAVCDDAGHYMCYSCLRRTMSEALFGQGWARSVDVGRCTLRCVAAADGCAGRVPPALVKLAVMTESKPGGDAWRRFEDRLVADSLARSGLELLRCPLCAYAQVKPRDPTTPADVLQRLVSNPPLAALLLLLAALAASFAAARALESSWLGASVGAAAHISPLLLPLPFAVLVAVGPRQLAAITTTLHARIALDARHAPAAAPAESSSSTRGRKFVCGAGAHAACLRCRARWTDPHACFAAHGPSLRAHVEAALTAAAKRTCPQCGLSFVKASGCNKLACPCGYTMCYLCRADVRRAGYGHFCPHFRAAGTGGCPVECGRCDLYVDEVVELDEVRRAAEEQWWAGEGRRRGLEGRRGDMAGVLEGLGGDDLAQSRSWLF